MDQRGAVPPPAAREGGHHRQGGGRGGVAQPDPQQIPVAQLPESGRGMAVMRACVDNVTLDSRPGRGTVGREAEGPGRRRLGVDYSPVPGRLEVETRGEAPG